MSRILYTVGCRFDSSEVAVAWADWLRDEHLAEVVEAGAKRATLVRMDGPDLHYQARYEFASRQAFETYEREQAPRLRAAGLERFPLSMGLAYERTVGEVEAHV